MVCACDHEYIMSWLKKLLRFGSKVRLVGVDLRGNQYYEQIMEGSLLDCV